MGDPPSEVGGLQDSVALSALISENSIGPCGDDGLPGKWNFKNMKHVHSTQY